MPANTHDLYIITKRALLSVSAKNSYSHGDIVTSEYEINTFNLCMQRKNQKCQ